MFYGVGEGGGGYIPLSYARGLRVPKPNIVKVAANVVATTTNILYKITISVSFGDLENLAKQNKQYT